jgi:hypothetical protein
MSSSTNPATGLTLGAAGSTGLRSRALTLEPTERTARSGRAGLTRRCSGLASLAAELHSLGRPRLSLQLVASKTICHVGRGRARLNWEALATVEAASGLARRLQLDVALSCVPSSPLPVTSVTSCSEWPLQRVTNRRAPTRESCSSCGLISRLVGHLKESPARSRSHGYAPITAHGPRPASEVLLRVVGEGRDSWARGEHRARPGR